MAISCVGRVKVVLFQCGNQKKLPNFTSFSPFAFLLYDGGGLSITDFPHTLLKLKVKNEISNKIS
jgi:hypothetical protein